MAPGKEDAVGIDEDYTKIVKHSDTFYAWAPAKLNITLKIGPREENGYHKLSSIMQTISLHDKMSLRVVKKGEEGIEGYVVKNNLIEKAIDALSGSIGKDLYCRIRATKTIPIAAGMGGGSSDAATALRMANVAFELGLSVDQLARVAEKVGNDIPFLLYGGRAKVEGSQSHTIKIIDMPVLYYLVARPRMELSTREMYTLHDKTGKDFTQLASELCPDTKKLLVEIKKGKPVESGVTGKGPTVFGSFDSYAACQAVAKKITWLDGDIFIEKSVGRLSLSL